ncbi:MAG: hypothetical protein JRJ59_04060, partial [Deltaproteobacteria bacterium]|nr:hypothetical protein [Deltaproteobacteria bacterium]
MEGGDRRSGSSSELEEMVLPGQAKRSMEGHIRELRFFQKELSRIDKELKRLAGLKRRRAKSA